jgi:hypothetical protein
MRVACRCRPVNVPEVMLRHIFVTEYGCHLWLGTLTEKGYGRVTRKQKGRKVHRLLWQMTGHNLPDYTPGGEQLDHLCLDKSCCNPAHLEIVTQLENMQRRTVLITHCRNGHEYTNDNILIRKGSKRCKQCERAAADRFRGRERPPGWLPPSERTYCDHGHLWETNAAYKPTGYRYCRACARLSHAKWKAKGN